MKRFFMLKLIFLLALNIGCTISKDRVQTSTGPKIFIKERMFNSGKVEQGDTISHTFIIANQGDEKLLIEKVKPG